MRRFWPFRNLSNFSITVVGLTGLGLLYNSISNQRVFSNSPVVNESIKILGLNNTTRALLGNPITYTGSFQNAYNIQEEQQFYSFNVKGSKTSTTAELSATRMKVSQLRKKIQNVRTLLTKITQKKQQQTKLMNSLKNLKKQQKYETDLKIQQIQKQIKTLNQQYETANRDKIESIIKYYIPDAALHQKVTRTKSPGTTISDDQYLYGIEALTARLPNRNTIDVLPAEEKLDKNSVTNLSIQKFSNATQLTEGYLNQRLKLGLDGLSDEEIESFGRHKTMMMYGKYNGYRIGISLLLTLGLITLFLSFHQFRIKPITGTFIAYQAQNLFINNRKTAEILSNLKKSKSNVRFSKIIGGGRKGDRFSCSTEIEGAPGMKVYFEGKQQANGQIKFNKFQLEYPQGNNLKKVDLL